MSARTYLVQHIYKGIRDLRTAPGLTKLQSDALTACLLDDAIAYLYSGIVTLSESIVGSEQRLFSWATVKAYYAVFYFVRAMTATSGRTLYYHTGSTPWTIIASLGAKPQKAKSNMHTLVFRQFQETFPNHWLLSQDIEMLSPVEWMKQKREATNYTVLRFVEPGTPNHFKRITQIGIRKAIASYTQKSNEILAFDPEHAILAYPIRALAHTLDAIQKRRQATLTPDEISYLSGLCKDKTGIIADFGRLLQ